MRRNEAHALIPEDQIDENPMEARIARIESDVSNIQKNLGRVELEVIELRKGQQAANEAITDIKIALGTVNHKLESLADRTYRLDAKIDERYDTLDAKIDERFNTLDTKIDSLDAKFSKTCESLDQKITETNRTLATLASTVHKMHGTMNTFGVGVSLIGGALAIVKWLSGEPG